MKSSRFPTIKRIPAGTAVKIVATGEAGRISQECACTSYFVHYEVYLESIKRVIVFNHEELAVYEKEISV